MGCRWEDNEWTGKCLSSMIDGAITPVPVDIIRIIMETRVTR